MARYSLTKMSDPGWEMETNDPAKVLWPHICNSCREDWIVEGEIICKAAVEDDVFSMLETPCGAEFWLEDNYES